MHKLSLLALLSISFSSLVVCSSNIQHPLNDETQNENHKSLENSFTYHESSQPDLNALLDLHKKLISIPSVSGNEHDVAIFLREYLGSAGLEVELQQIPAKHSMTQDSSEPSRPRYNVLAHPVKHRQTPILLTSHIDTVPPYIPYSTRFGNEIWGRGSVDAKACVATQIHAYLQLVRAGQIRPQDASLLFVVGEETNADGMFAANSLGLRWDTVIFGEPTELKLATGHKGLIILYVKATGKGGHSGYVLSPGLKIDDGTDEVQHIAIHG